VPTQPQQQRRRLGGILATWPRRLGALIVSGVVAWAVGRFTPVLWQELIERAGLAPAPLQVEVVTDVDRIDDTAHPHIPEFVIDKPIEQIGPPPNDDREDGRYAWAHGMDGVDATQSLVRLVLRGQTSSPVEVFGIRVEAVHRGPPLAGTVVSYFGQGAPQPVRYIEVDLDADPPRDVHIGDDGQAAAFNYNVSSDQHEVIDVIAKTMRHDVSWRLHVGYIADDQQDWITVPDGGKSFRTTARADPAFWTEFGDGSPPRQTAYGWLNGQWQPLTP
jgi:hypothetical protein